MLRIGYRISDKVTKFLVIQVLVTTNIGWVLLAFINPSLAVDLTKEDNILQWLQVLFLLATAFYCLKIYRGYRLLQEKKLIAIAFLIFFILTLFVAFEEISWGQRIFGIATPDFIKEVNLQNEITIHNLSYFQRVRHWLLILFGGTGLILIYQQTYIYKINAQLLALSPPTFFSTAFLLVLISGMTLEIAYLFIKVAPGDIANEVRYWAGRFSEIGEFGVSITAFSYASNKLNSLLSSPLKEKPK